MTNRKKGLCIFLVLAQLLGAPLVVLAENSNPIIIFENPTGNSALEETPTDNTGGTNQDGGFIVITSPPSGIIVITPQPTDSPSPSPSPTPTNPPAENLYAYVNTSSLSVRLNLYETASTNAKVLGSYYKGTRVKVLQFGNTWCYVEVDSSVGYMQTVYLSFGNDTGTGDATVRYAVVNNPNAGDGLNLREYPSTSSASLGKYYNGTNVKVLEYGTNWCRVEVGGRTGYMMTTYLSFDTGSSGGGTGTVTYAVVNNPNPLDALNLRQYPSTGSTSLGKYYNGTSVKVLEYGSAWCKVQVGSLAGYMMTAYLSFDSGGSSGGNTGNYTYALVNNANPTDWLNLRAQASTSSAILGQYFNGTSVHVLEYGSVWCRVLVDGKTGYMMTRYLSFSGSSGGGGSTGTGTGYAAVKNPVSTQRLHLRAQATKSSTSLGLYANGTIVKVLSYGAEWCQVQVQSDGKTGYMMTTYLSFSGTSATGKTVGIVSNPVSTQRLNLRARPTTSSQSLGQYYNGTVVTILEYGATWCYVEVNGIKGYMMTQYLKFSA